MSEETPRVIWVETSHKRYPIYIGENILTPDFFETHFSLLNDVFLVTDDVVGPLYLKQLESVLAHTEFSECVIPHGEHNKSVDVIQSIFKALINSNKHRDTCIFALGGGVVGDMAGFAASCYQRGVRLMQIPTTLLAQVDASVGGKTGFNYLGEKNVIGSFYQPDGVVIDISVLNTLPEREYTAGLAEVIKYGLLGDHRFFEWIEKNADAIRKKEKHALLYMIEKCCQMKADIVCQDENEKDIRALLNLGHTFAHAIESATNYKTYYHGEAVAIGLHCSALMSHKLGDINKVTLDRVKALISLMGLPTMLPKDIKTDRLLALMQRDKKVIQSTLSIVLLREIGHSYIESIADNSIIQKVLEEVRS